MEVLEWEHGHLSGVQCRGVGEFGLGRKRWRSGEVNCRREFKVHILSDGGADGSKSPSLFPPPCLHALWHRPPNLTRGLNGNFFGQWTNSKCLVSRDMKNTRALR